MEDFDSPRTAAILPLPLQDNGGKAKLCLLMLAPTVS